MVLALAVAMFESLIQDLRYAARALARNRGFTAVAVLTLALGIGANAAVFSVVNAVLLRPLPYDRPDQLVMAWEAHAAQGIEGHLASAPTYLDWKDQTRGLSHVAAFRPSLSYNLTGTDRPVRISVTLSSATLFPLLGVTPALGRTFLPEEDRPGGHLVAVISHGLWSSQFGGDRGVIGKTLTLHDTTRTIVGVMPPAFEFPLRPGEKTDVWIPLALGSRETDLDRGHHFLQVVGRVAPHATRAQAQAELGAIARRLEEQHPASNAGWTVRLVPLAEHLYGKLPLALILLEVVVGFVLLIACVNVANLLLARAESRQKEIAIRRAVGASRLRIVQQLVTESVLLALVGAALALALVSWGAPALFALLPESLPRAAPVTIDGRVIAATLGLAALTSVLFGLGPALLASRPATYELLKGGRRSVAPSSRGRLRQALAVAQVALGLVLLVGAALLINSFVRLQRVDPGFDAARVLTLELYLPRHRYPEEHQRAAFYGEVLRRIEALPGTRSAALVTSLPIVGRYSWVRDVAVEGRAPSSSSERQIARWRAITPQYFRAMGIPLRAGAPFSDADRAGAREVTIVNEAFVRRYLPDEHAIGKRLRITAGPPRVIVGVVGDVKDDLTAAASEPEVYVPYLQSPENYVTIVVRADGAPRELAAAAQGEVRAVDPDLPLFNVRTLDDVVAGSVARPRFQAFLVGAFAGLALLLAAVGLYGVLSYSVSQRMHEIGIRMALGATERLVLGQVLRQGFAVIAVGLAIGLGVSLALTRAIASLLYDVSATDPLTFIGVAILFLTVGAVACWFPARRATRADPMAAIRAE